MSNQDHKYFDEEINLKRLFVDIYSRKKIYSLCLVLTIIITSICLKLIPDQYQSSSVLSINESSTGNMQSSLGGVSLAFNPLSALGANGAASRKSYALRLLKSRTFFEYFIDKNNEIFVQIFAFDSYNKESKNNLFNKDIYDNSSKTWREGLSNGGKPSMLVAHKIFLSHIKFEEEETREGYLTLKVNHQSPSLAYEWLENIIVTFNAYVRDKEQLEANLALEYYNSVITETQVPEIKSAIANLIKNKIKDLAIINVNEQYILNVIDKPYLPEKSTYPNRTFFLIIIITIFILLIILFSALFPRLESKKSDPNF